MPDRVEKLSRLLLYQKIDPIPRFRILRDFLKLPDDDPELLAAREAIKKSRWYQHLVDGLHQPLPEHLIRGEWRIRHSNGSGNRLFQSLDDYVVRAKQIGLTANDPELRPLVDYLLDCIHGRITVHETINPALGRLLAAGLLRHLIVNHPAEEPYAAVLAGAVSEAYSSGQFDSQKYAATLREALEIPDSQSVPLVETEFVLILLHGRLNPSIERLLANDLLTRTRGIIGLNNRTMIHLPLSFPSAEACRYIMALDVLAGFEQAIDLLGFAKDWLYTCADEDGLWDMSLECRDGIMLPLSESWRTAWHRRTDVSIQIIHVLQKLERSCSLRDIICHPL